MNAPTETKQNLKLQAYSILKEKIVSCEYRPGSMLNEAQLAAELGFSRYPAERYRPDLSGPHGN